MDCLWDDRLAEGWAPPGHAGSAVVVGDYGVLTARHVVAAAVNGSAAGPVLARVVRKGVPPQWVPTRVMCDAPEWDLAVLEVDRSQPAAAAWVRPAAASPVVVVVGGTSVDGCEAVGFPDEETQRPEGAGPGGVVRQTEQLQGTLLPSGQARPPIRLHPSLPMEWMPLDVLTATPGTEVGWRGMSGAGVLLPDGRLVGIVVAAEDSHQQRRLYVVPLAAALTQSPSLARALTVVAGAPMVAEAKSAPVNRRALYIQSLGADGVPQKLCEVTDLGVFGVKPVDLADEPPYLNYVPRDDDGKLVAVLRTAATARVVLLLVGDSGSGKSRSAAKAACDTLPEHRLLRPAEHQLPQLPDLPLTDLGPTLVWLDDIEKYAHPALRATLQRLLQFNTVIVATIRRQELQELTTSGEIRNPSGEALTDRRLVQHLDWRREWSQAERNRISSHIANPVARQAVAAGLPLGVWAVAGPQLVDRLDLARSDEDYPCRFALVRAVLDWYRTGTTTPVPRLVVGDLVNRAYLGQPASHADISDAIAWCTHPVDVGGRRAHYSLLTIRHGGLAINDYVQDNDRRHTPPPVPDPTWSAALASASNDDLLTALGVAAYQAGHATTAQDAFRRLAIGGSVYAMFNLGLLLKDTDPAESQRWYKQARAAALRRLDAIQVL